MPTTLRPRDITITDYISYQERSDREWRQLQQSIAEAHTERLRRQVDADVLRQLTEMADIVSPELESSYQELDRVTSARAHGGLRVRPGYQRIWPTVEPPAPPAPARRRVHSSLSVLAEAERKIKG